MTHIAKATNRSPLLTRLFAILALIASKLSWLNPAAARQARAMQALLEQLDALMTSFRNGTLIPEAPKAEAPKPSPAQTAPRQARPGAAKPRARAQLRARPAPAPTRAPLRRSQTFPQAPTLPNAAKAFAVKPVFSNFLDASAERLIALYSFRLFIYY